MVASPWPPAIASSHFCQLDVFSPDGRGDRIGLPGLCWSHDFRSDNWSFQPGSERASWLRRSSGLLDFRHPESSLNCWKNIYTTNLYISVSLQPLYMQRLHILRHKLYKYFMYSVKKPSLKKWNVYKLKNCSTEKNDVIKYASGTAYKKLNKDIKAVQSFCCWNFYKCLLFIQYTHTLYTGFSHPDNLNRISKRQCSRAGTGYAASWMLLEVS